MNLWQVSKRILLLVAVNTLVVTTIGIIVSLVMPLVFHKGIPTKTYAPLMVICVLWGFGGAFISLLISRWMAKTMMGVQVIDSNTSDPTERELLRMVENLSRTANIPMPEVGIYHSPEINAFATGPSKSRSLVAVSSGLINNMRRSEVEGVVGHEIAHIANGDMVTMTLIQGVINAFVLFLSHILAFAVSQALASRNSDDDRPSTGNWMLQWLLVNVFQMIFSVLGFVVVAWFSRWREFRADAGGARYAGRERMVAALRALQHVHEQGADQAGEPKPAFAALKISGGGILSLFSTHPPLEERIARLEKPIGY